MARSYTIESLESPLQPDDPVWSSADSQRNYPYAEQFAKLGLAGVAGALATGFIPVGTSGRLMDYYVRAARTIEDLSPGGILRTFQVSNTLQQFTSANMRDRFISGQQLQALLNPQALPSAVLNIPVGGNADWWRATAENLLRADPAQQQSILAKGLFFKGGTFAGELRLGSATGEVLLPYASVATSFTPEFHPLTGLSTRAIDPANVERGPVGLLKNVAVENYYRGIGFIPEAPGGTLTAAAERARVGAFARAGPANRIGGTMASHVSIAPFHFMGGRNLGEHIGRQAYGWFTGAIEGFNRLFTNPVDWFPDIQSTNATVSGRLRQTMEQVGLWPGVKSRGAAQTLARIGGKLVLVGGGLTLGYETADWAAREIGLPEGGLTAFGARTIAGAHIFASSTAEWTGLQEYARTQEEVAPGSTDLTRLAGFPLAGALIGASGAWTAGAAERIRDSRSMGWGAAQLLHAERTAERATGVLGQLAGWAEQSRVGRLIVGGGSRVRMASLIGAAAGAALVAPFIPGALIPQQSPEELEAIYSGQQEVPIMKNRWWMFGRCLTKSTTCGLFAGGTKKAKDVLIGDILIGRNGRPVRVLDIFSRMYSGKILRFYSAFNMNIPTELTPNHIVPVLRDGQIIEVEAQDIQKNELVEVSFVQKDTESTYLDLVSLLQNKYLIHLENNRIYAGQRTRRPGQIVKSGKHSVPERIELDFDLGWLFGIFLAEGSLVYRKSSGTPHLIETVHNASREQWVAAKIKDIVYSKFGTEVFIQEKARTENTIEGVLGVRICSSILAKIFNLLFYLNDTKRPDSWSDKHVPKICKDAPAEFKYGILEGYWTGDGHLDRNSRIISSSRLWLLTEIQDIALSLGLLSGISVPEPTYRRPRYRLRFSPNRKDNKYNLSIVSFQDRVFARIRRIETEEYTDIVYDFEVDDPDHLFLAGTFLVHNSPYEGKGISYYRPHRLALLSMGRSGTDVDLYGSDEPSPLGKFWKENFTYDIEEQNYYRRPYPMTGRAFSDIPIFGDFLAATVGQLVKPQRLMHAEEFMREGEGGTEYLHQPIGWGEKRGEFDLPPGAPVVRTGLAQYFGEQMRDLGDIMGLRGFALESLKAGITGTPEFFDQESQMASAEEMFSAGRSFWDWNLGDPAGSCFVKGTKIKTLDGEINIEDVRPGDQVLSDGCYRSVSNTLRRKPTQQILKIRTAGLNTEFKCTANHVIPVLRRHKYGGLSQHLKPFEERYYDILELEAKDLQKGDYLFYEIDNSIIESPAIDFSVGNPVYTDNYIYVRASLPFARAFELLEADASLTRKDLRNAGIPDQIAKDVLKYFRNGQVPERVLRHQPLTKDLAYAIGWYIAEGSTDDGRLNLAMHAQEKDYAIEIGEIFKRIFDAEYSIKIRENRLQLRIGSSILARAMPILVGNGAHNKFIPQVIKRAPLDIVESAVKSLMLGDGWTKGFTSVSKKLVKDLADCFLRLGIYISVYLDYLEIPTEGTLYPQGTLRHPSLRNYLVLQSGVRNKWRFFGTSFLTPVKSVTPELEIPEEVYDLEIEDIHFYTADGILVHNTEFARRIYPSKRKQIEQYNPLRNQMPEWMPGPESRGPNLQYGDPYSAIPEGELRLPGPMYEKLHPELAGLDPENYPSVYQHKILADIAPYSDEFKQSISRVRSDMSQGLLSEEQIALYKQTMQRRREIVESKQQFMPRKYAEKSVEDLAATNREIAETPGVFARLQEYLGVGSYWETLSHGIEDVPPIAALEQFTPASPLSKFTHMRTAVEDYERTQLFSSEMAMWNQPWSNFIRPAIESAGENVGFDDPPEHIQEKRRLSDYFDALEYIKATKLKTESEDYDLQAAARHYEEQRRETLAGVNPFTHQYTQIYRALPGPEKNYFQAFSEMTLPEQQQRVLEMVPENERGLYMARWMINTREQAAKLVDDETVDESIRTEAAKYIEETYQVQKMEGFPVDDDLWKEFQNNRREGESYADWYRRTRLLPKKLAGMPVPGPSWVGWNPELSLSDVKLRVLENLGESKFDYDLWQSNERRAAYRPMARVAANELMEANTPGSVLEARQAIYDILASDTAFGSPSVEISPSYQSEVEMDLEYHNDREIKDAFGTF